MASQELVSIIMPTYKCGRFIAESIKSVQAQTYKNWELLLINDCSKDKSKKIAKKYLSDKVKWIDMPTNSGAASARNKGIELSSGDYICFLDADDLWEKEKLEKQVNFMKEKSSGFSFTGYEFADENGKPTGTKVKIPTTINYQQALKNTTIWTSTVMLDMQKLSKEDIYMPIVKSEDTACWWKILKKVESADGLNEILSYYRRSSGTLSSNKIEAIKRIWNLYRNVEHLGLIKSCYCFIGYAFNAVKRRI